ncbi:MAG: hypothetical protein HQM10_17125 [Candidatus Riflebacteria bacterium]|nr:hypothetical protein [Candidatus Riflebacteria bacterium]
MMQSEIKKIRLCWDHKAADKSKFSKLFEKNESDLFKPASLEEYFEFLEEVRPFEKEVRNCIVFSERFILRKN